LVFTATDDWTDPRVTQALKELGIRRLRVYREKHEGERGAHWQAELIMLDQVHEQTMQLTAIVVAGPDVCTDC